MDFSALFPIDSVFWYKNRLKTFEHWPFKSLQISCNPERMAAAGFIAIGGENEPDLAECIFCFKQLNGWEPTDDPWNEHARHQTQSPCPYVAINKCDETKLTIDELYKLRITHYTQTLTREKDNILLALTKLQDELTNKKMISLKQSKKK